MKAIKFSADNLSFRLLTLYGFLCPLLILRFGDLTIGAADLLSPFALLIILIFLNRTQPASLLYMGYTLVAVLSVILSPYGLKIDPLLQAVRLFTVFLPFALVFNISNLTEEMSTKIIDSVFYGALLGVLIGLIFYAVGYEVRDAQKLWSRTGQGQTLRASGIVGNTGPYGMLVALLFMVQIVRINIGRSKYLSLNSLVTFSAVLLAILASSSRGGMLMILAFVATWLLTRKLNYSRLAIFAFIFISGIVVANLSINVDNLDPFVRACLLYTSPSPRDA